MPPLYNRRNAGLDENFGLEVAANDAAQTNALQPRMIGLDPHQSGLRASSALHSGNLQNAIKTVNNLESERSDAQRQQNSNRDFLFRMGNAALNNNRQDFAQRLNEERLAQQQSQFEAKQQGAIDQNSNKGFDAINKGFDTQDSHAVTEGLKYGSKYVGGVPAVTNAIQNGNTSALQPVGKPDKPIKTPPIDTKKEAGFYVNQAKANGYETKGLFADDPNNTGIRTPNANHEEFVQTIQGVKARNPAWSDQQVIDEAAKLTNLPRTGGGLQTTPAPTPTPTPAVPTTGLNPTPNSIVPPAPATATLTPAPPLAIPPIQAPSARMSPPVTSPQADDGTVNTKSVSDGSVLANIPSISGPQVNGALQTTLPPTVQDSSGVNALKSAVSAPSKSNMAGQDYKQVLASRGYDVSGLNGPKYKAFTDSFNAVKQRAEAQGQPVSDEEALNTAARMHDVYSQIPPEHQTTYALAMHDLKSPNPDKAEHARFVLQQIGVDPQTGKLIPAQVQQ